MTHLRRCDIASIKCRVSIFHVDNISRLWLYIQPFSTPGRCDNRYAVELRKGPVLSGRRERLQGGPRQPAAAHPFPQGSVRKSRRPEPKEPSGTPPRSAERACPGHDRRPASRAASSPTGAPTRSARRGSTCSSRSTPARSPRPGCAPTCSIPGSAARSRLSRRRPEPPGAAGQRRRRLPRPRPPRMHPQRRTGHGLRRFVARECVGRKDHPRHGNPARSILCQKALFCRCSVATRRR
jgi:hypothetical protein